jgi:hypothetical protein
MESLGLENPLLSPNASVVTPLAAEPEATDARKIPPFVYWRFMKATVPLEDIDTSISSDGVVLLHTSSMLVGVPPPEATR